jgi:hypothetical protein
MKTGDNRYSCPSSAQSLETSRMAFKDGNIKCRRISCRSSTGRFSMMVTGNPTYLLKVEKSYGRCSHAFHIGPYMKRRVVRYERRFFSNYIYNTSVQVLEVI